MSNFNQIFGRVDFNMKSEDLNQVWFHKVASRDVAHKLLENSEAGSFLIRPSSQAGSYAMSWVKNRNGEIGHNLIYGLCPGYSLKQNPTSPTDRYWSLQALVESCDYLRIPIRADHETTSLAKSSNAKTNSEVVGRIIEKLVNNDATLGELVWNLCIIGESANETANRCQKRTYVKYCDEEYTAPEILALNGNSLSLIAQSLHNNDKTHSLHINGYEGYLRMNFQANIGDPEASALAQMLLKNKSITLLNLNVNEITDVGAKALAFALKTNTNFIGKEGLVALSEAIRVNRTLDFVDVSSQLYKSKGLINLAHSNTERTLAALLEDTLKRKCELLGMSNDTAEGAVSAQIPQHLTSNNSNIHNISLQRLPYFHGFLTRASAEKRLRLVGTSVGSFLFYLNHYVPNSIFLAYIAQRDGSTEVIHRMIHRVHFGYRFVNGGLSSNDLMQQQDLRDEQVEEEMLYNYMINNRSNENTITHTNSYNYAYRYRPRRKGCGIVIPTLFEFCSWTLASSEQYPDILRELSQISNVISDRFQDIHDLVPLWGSRDIQPVVSLLQHTKQPISRKTVYTTLSQLYKHNNKKLINPVTRDQYKSLRFHLSIQEEIQNNQNNQNNSKQ
eukprot:gene7932-9322_t